MPFPRKHRRFLDQLVQNRFRPEQVRKLLNERRAAALAASAVSSEPKCLTGTHGGMFYRIRVPPSHQRLSLLPLTIPKLHTPTSPPMRLTSLPPVEQSGASACASAGAVLAASPKKGPRYADFWDRLYRWLRENSATLVLNVGSICTLVGFTRTDVLDLRRLSVAGSLCAVFYHCMLTPVRLPPILWSFTFAGVNSYKIYEILVERQGAVNLTQEQEERYIRFFMPHGVTPKQFELIQQKAKVLHIKKGTILIRQNVELNHVYLVVNGTTRASVLGRYLTAASTAPTAHDERMGDASGAWIGEMSLLERVWLREQGKQQLRAKEGGTTVPVASLSSASASTTTPAALSSTTTPATGSRHTNDSSESGNDSASRGTPPPAQQSRLQKQQSPLPAASQSSAPETPNNNNNHQLKASHCMCTIVASEDCLVLRWSHGDMEELMAKSTDMRAALTRAMTAAVVGKVISFTVSRSKTPPTWSSWLEDWQNNAGARVQISTGDEEGDNSDDDNDDETQSLPSPRENLPSYPIKRFQ